MKNAISILSFSLALMASPAIAQDANDTEATAEAVEAAADAAAEAVAVAIEAVDEYEQAFPRKPGLRSWEMVRPLDYPIAAWRNDEEGFVAYSVEVDAAGKPTSCTVTESSGSKTLDDALCSIVMERGEFRPAMAGPDEPVAGTYQGYHEWRKREPDMPQMSVVFRYTHGADGQSTNCEFLKLEDIPEKMRKEIERDIERGRLCRNGGFGGSRGIPYRDQDGNPVAKIVTVKFDVQLEDPVEPVE